MDEVALMEGDIVSGRRSVFQEGDSVATSVGRISACKWVFVQRPKGYFCPAILDAVVRVISLSRN